MKPIVKITGEFWAQTTEGDGNFNMFNFLQKEGAQVLVEPIGTWIMYMIHQVVQKYKDFKGLDEGAVLPPIWKLGTRAKIEFDYRQKVAKLKLAEAIFKREYHKIVDALGGIAHHLADQYELQRLGHPFYNSRAGGGEGHLEVAKNIYYSNKDLAHMVLSLKPFGCMPSTQSDGAQSAVVSNLQGHDLPARRDLRRRRNQRPLAACRWRSARPRTRPRRNSPKRWRRPASRSTSAAPGWKRIPKPSGPCTRCRTPRAWSGGAANFVLHIAERMKAEAPRPRSWRGRELGSTMDKTFPHRHGCRLDHGESRGDRRRHRPDPLEDYQRHDTKQPEKVLEFLKRIEAEIDGFDAERSRMFITGSRRQRHGASTSAPSSCRK